MSYLRAHTWAIGLGCNEETSSPSLPFFKLQSLGKTVNKDHREQLFHVKRIINSSIVTRFPRFLAKHLFLYSLCSVPRLCKRLKPVEGSRFLQTHPVLSGRTVLAPGSGPVCGGERIWATLPPPAQEHQAPFGPATRLPYIQCSLLPHLVGPGHSSKSDQGGPASITQGLSINL